MSEYPDPPKATDYITERAHTIYELAEGGGVPSDAYIALYRIYAVLSFAKGTATTAEDVHDAWSAWQVATVPNHRSLKPFDELTPDVQHLDDKYVAAIHQASM